MTRTSLRSSDIPWPKRFGPRRIIWRVVAQRAREIRVRETRARFVRVMRTIRQRLPARGESLDRATILTTGLHVLLGNELQTAFTLLR